MKVKSNRINFVSPEQPDTLGVERYDPTKKKESPVFVPPHGNNLLPETAEKYFVPTIKPNTYKFEGFGQIDLRTLTLDEADNLFVKEFPFLQLRIVNI